MSALSQIIGDGSTGSGRRGESLGGGVIAMPGGRWRGGTMLKNGENVLAYGMIREYGDVPAMWGGVAGPYAAAEGKTVSCLRAWTGGEYRT